MQKCIDDAKQRGKKGVAVLTNDHTSWTPSKALFLQHQFQLVATATAPFDFELLVYPFSGDVELPYFPE
ncbi:GNAT family N-acetyltransferase, partial [Lysinibacillus fusiformis]|nr:GNAT family N-acetyltransferase [Lysinibacillus fusiformis]